MLTHNILLLLTNLFVVLVTTKASYKDYSESDNYYYLNQYLPRIKEPVSNFRPFYPYYYQDSEPSYKMDPYYYYKYKTIVQPPSIQNRGGKSFAVGFRDVKHHRQHLLHKQQVQKKNEEIAEKIENVERSPSDDIPHPEQSPFDSSISLKLWQIPEPEETNEVVEANDENFGYDEPRYD